MRKRNPTAQVRALATHLIGLIEPDVIERLTTDPDHVIRDYFGISVRYVAPSNDGRCSIDGTYTADPPTITVATALSGGRERFSVLHELGHHLQRNDFDAIDALNRAGKNRRTLEEDVSDAFAAAILLPEGAVDEALDGQLPSARAVARLYASHRASRAACCVRIAQRLRTSGYVVVIDMYGRVAFAAAAGDAYPLARGTEQDPDSLFQLALMRQTARGKVRVTYASGWQSPVFFGEFERADDWVFGVLQNQPPAWQVVPLSEEEHKPRPPHVECELCGETFPGWQPACEECGIRECPNCGRCACSRGPAPRTCQGCWLLLPPSQFPDGGDFCIECS